MFGLGIAKTASGIAKTVTGKVKDFRGVLATNPGALGLALPPQVQLGINVANSLGLKIPSADVLSKQVMSELDKAVFGLYRPSTKDLLNGLKGRVSTTPGLDQYLEQLRKSGNSTLDKIEEATNTAEDLLSSINWLL
ncbi:MAG: hypothetical protein KME59_21460 [Trichormus sp. ATA11-4-KO1]|jgi:hypothetical protein|nr:hypothetical protein [Trichormus sp. ATA11-4-KO1]